MKTNDWPAEDYAIGSYVQATVAQSYLQRLQFKPQDRVLDVGCGNGSFTEHLIKMLPDGLILGVDASENMVELASKLCEVYPNFSVQVMDMQSLNFTEEFDYIVSFWCLQWAKDLIAVYNNMYRALKEGGKLFLLFPSGDDPFINTAVAVTESGQFPELNNFISPVNRSQYSNFNRLNENLAKNGLFKKFHLERNQHSMLLPSLDIFRKFVKGVGYFQGQVPPALIDEINEAMVRMYEKECQEKYQGQYYFNFSLYILEAEK
ncbi:putative methyltransferase [Legionella birminghamensis]|uniref:Methyltransferase n=1 Tax=Legionella birminghamensis TaxID=28083 RepID=A0A378I8R0_9GAMM|nr:class I SAM-dependent methyltransferase [Legionella birminghamensis]KTC68907.1 putative methyltransferase [Legionella birminghamensis]STX31423.1 Putative methyltransferase [Legionella birminghamensis]